MEAVLKYVRIQQDLQAVVAIQDTNGSIIGGGTLQAAMVCY